MKLDVKKCLLIGFMAINTFAVSAQQLEDAPARISVLDRMTFTLNPNLVTTGPILRDNQNHSEYSKELIKLILKEGHERAKAYLESGAHKAYYAFMVLALTVPLHEGIYIHFRENANDGTLCNHYANDGDLVREKASNTVATLFNSHLKDTNIIPNCDTLTDEENLKQIIRGGDGSDMGIMQISIRWHHERYYTPKLFLDVAKSVRFGLNHIYRGFNGAYRNVANYSCIRKNRRSAINYENLIKGAWAGIYNSGNMGATCRFANADSAYKAHDDHFKNNLNKIYAFTHSKEIQAMGSFKVSLPTLEQNAMIEVINNFKRNTNNRTHLNQLLAQ